MPPWRDRVLCLLLPLAASLLVLCMGARAAAATPEVVIEIDAGADASLDARLTRRLIGLELREVELAPAPSPPPRGRGSIFVRVLGEARDRLRVELWELGAFHGSRTVTIAPQGSRYLRAQRVALVAAELARRLRQERLRSLREQERARIAAVASSPGAEAALPRSRLLLTTSGRAAATGRDSVALWGPSLGGDLNVLGRANLEMAATWLFGSAFGIPHAPSLEWLELSVAPSYSLPYAGRFGLRLGARASAAALHLGQVSGVDGIAGQRDTWSARAVAELRLDFAWTRGVALRLGPDFGAVLRRVPVVDQAGVARSLGGYWLGLSLGVTLDPGARDLGQGARKAEGQRTADGLAPHGKDSRGGPRP